MRLKVRHKNRGQHEMKKEGMSKIIVKHRDLDFKAYWRSSSKAANQRKFKGKTVSTSISWRVFMLLVSCVSVTYTPHTPEINIPIKLSFTSGK